MKDIADQKLAELKNELAEAKLQLAAAEGDDEKTFAQNEVDKILAQINASGSGAATPKTAAKPKKSNRGRRATPVAVHSFEYEGKTYVEGVDKDFCEKLKEATAARQQQAEKSAGKYKTKSLSVKVADSLTHPIKHVVDNISDTEIEKHPKRVLVKLRSMKKNALALIADFKSLLPNNGSKKMEEPIALIKTAIEEIEAGVSGKKKMAKGGKIDTREFRYLILDQTKTGLKISLTPDGKEKAAEDGLSWQNFDDYFDDVQGNSEFRFVPDLGDVGLGMTSAPGITDGYYYNDDSELTDKGHNDSEVYYYDLYATIDFAEKLKEEGEVFFDRAPNKN